MLDPSPPSALLQETEAFLHQQIPLTQSMGVQVRGWDGQCLRLEAPLGPNHNHLGTAFGGSLSALATLAGYSWLWLRLGDRGVHIVIRESRIRFRHPVRGVLSATCSAPLPPAWEAFQTEMSQRGRARLGLAVTMEEEGRVCVEFEGEFVAMR